MRPAAPRCEYLYKIAVDGLSTGGSLFFCTLVGSPITTEFSKNNRQHVCGNCNGKESRWPPDWGNRLDVVEQRLSTEYWTKVISTRPPRCTCFLSLVFGSKPFRIPRVCFMLVCSIMFVCMSLCENHRVSVSSPKLPARQGFNQTASLSGLGVFVACVIQRRH